MQQQRIALIGGGFMGKAHSLAFAAMPMFFWPPPALPVRAVVADVTQEAAEEAAQRFGYARATADWREAVESDEVDVVDIVTPNHLHAEIAVAAAAAGKHVICEKPLARTAAEARTMLDAVERAGVTHLVCFSYRRTPAVALARRLLDEGAIGEVRNFRGTYLQDWPADPDSPLSWRFQREVAGSGALGDIGTHVLDLARYLVGEVSEVCAMLSTYITQRPVQAGGVDQLGAAGRAGADTPKGLVDVDDEVVSMLRFANGAVGSLEATRNAYGRNNFLTFELHGSKGSLYFNYERRDELQVFFADDPADRRGFRTIYTGPQHPYGEGLWPIPALGIGFGETKIIECYDFFQAVRDGTQPSPNFADGARIAEISDALVRSSDTRSWVKVDG